MKTIINTVLFFLFPFFLNAKDCNQKTREIHSKVIESIGISFPLSPELIISDTEKSVAYISKKGIVIEQKLIDMFCGDENFDSKIAYVIAHELAHHYLNHNWMKSSGLVYNNTSIGDFFYDQSKDKDQRKIAESQADLFGGFYGQIAGYNVLPYAEETLRKVYDEYNIPIESDLYPDLEERVTIINSNIEKAESLNELFDLGNVLMLSNSYVKAKECYEDILKNNFNSREIINNLGLVYLKFGVSISDQNVSNIIYPMFLDNNTRLSIEKSRSGSFSNNPKDLFKTAISLFEKAIDIDKNYYPSKQNLFVAKYLDSEKDRRKRVIEDILDSDLTDSIKNDFRVIDMLFNDEKKKKILKIANMGSYVSKLNISESSQNINFFSDSSVLDKLGIDQSEYVFGFSMPFKTIKSFNGSLKIKRKVFGKNILYDFNNLLVLKSSDGIFKNQILYNNNYYCVINLE